MNLIKKSCDLLIRQEAYVSVRIYDAPELEGTKLLVTKENVFGFVADQELQARLIHSAREVLNKRKSEKKTLESSIGTLNVFFEASLPNGKMLGTIGGVCVEARIQTEALKILTKERTTRTITAHLTDEMGTYDGDICGGTMIMLVEYLPFIDAERFS